MKKLLVGASIIALTSIGALALADDDQTANTPDAAQTAPAPNNDSASPEVSDTGVTDTSQDNDAALPATDADNSDNSDDNTATEDSTSTD